MNLSKIKESSISLTKSLKTAEKISKGLVRHYMGKTPKEPNGINDTEPKDSIDSVETSKSSK